MCVVCVIQAAADSRSRSPTRGAGVMYHTCIRCVAYDTFITRCAAVLLVRESIQGFSFAHGDRHSSYAEAEYTVNFHKSEKYKNKRGGTLKTFYSGNAKKQWKFGKKFV